MEWTGKGKTGGAANREKKQKAPPKLGRAWLEFCQGAPHRSFRYAARHSGVQAERAQRVRRHLHGWGQGGPPSAFRAGSRKHGATATFNWVKVGVGWASGVPGVGFVRAASAAAANGGTAHDR